MEGTCGLAAIDCLFVYLCCYAVPFPDPPAHRSATSQSKVAAAAFVTVVGGMSLVISLLVIGEPRVGAAEVWTEGSRAGLGAGPVESRRRGTSAA